MHRCAARAASALRPRVGSRQLERAPRPVPRCARPWRPASRASPGRRSRRDRRHTTRASAAGPPDRRRPHQPGEPGSRAHDPRRWPPCARDRRCAATTNADHQTPVLRLDREVALMGLHRGLEDLAWNLEELVVESADSDSRATRPGSPPRRTTFSGTTRCPGDAPGCGFDPLSQERRALLLVVHDQACAPWPARSHRPPAPICGFSARNRGPM